MATTPVASKRRKSSESSGETANVAAEEKVSAKPATKPTIRKRGRATTFEPVEPTMDVEHIRDLTKAYVDAILRGEMQYHLTSERSHSFGTVPNNKNGYNSKMLTTEVGRILVHIPRDRQATYVPVLISKYARTFFGVVPRVESLYHAKDDRPLVRTILMAIYNHQVAPAMLSQVVTEVIQTTLVLHEREARLAHAQKRA